MRKLRYAIIGSGMMGHEHLKNLALIRTMDALPIEVSAVVDPDAGMRESALELARELGNPAVRAHARCEELPPDAADVYVVVSPNHTHYAIVRKLLPYGKPILVEKPLCASASHCEHLLRLLENYPAPFWVAMEYRYMPPTARFLNSLASGDVGQLHLLSIREHRYPFLQKVGNWNRFSANTGGTLVEKCCHHFDLMRLITGAEPLRIFASGSTAVNHRDERVDGRVPDILDNAMVIVEFDNGVRASLELCMFCEGAEPQEQYSAIGDKGKLDVFIPGPDRFWPEAGERRATVVFSPRDQSTPRVDTLDLDPALASAGDHHGATYFQHRRFAHAVLRGAEVEVSASDGAIAVRMGAAAQESIRTGQVVDLASFTDSLSERGNPRLGDV